MPIPPDVNLFTSGGKKKKNPSTGKVPLVGYVFPPFAMHRARSYYLHASATVPDIYSPTPAPTAVSTKPPSALGMRSFPETRGREDHQPSA